MCITTGDSEYIILYKACNKLSLKAWEYSLSQKILKFNCCENKSWAIFKQ